MMPQAKDMISGNPMELLGWYDMLVAPHPYRKQLMDWGYRLDEEVLLDDFLYFLQAMSGEPVGWQYQLLRRPRRR